MFFVYVASSFRIYFIFTAVSVKCRVAAVKKTLHTFSQRKIYIFWSLEVIGLILSPFEDKGPLKLGLARRGGSGGDA